MYNKAIFMGNLTRDIELRYLQSGTAVATSSIATTRVFKVNGEKKEDTCFMDFTVWGKAAETFNQYCRKGSKMMLEGNIKHDTWVDQNGQKRSKHTLNVDEFKFLDSKADADRKAQNANQNNGQGGGYQEPSYNQPSYQEPQQGQQQSYQAPQQGQQQRRQPEIVYENQNGGSQTQQQHQQQTQSYQQPQQGQQNNGGQQQQRPQQNAGYNQQNQQARQMPAPDGVPVIDIDEDEIPFNEA